MGVNEDKIAKAKVIEGMLQELDMSKQELIDLIKSLMEQSISEEKGENISQDASDVKLKNSDKGIDENLTLEQLAEKLASGDAKYLEKYLTVEQIKNLSIRVGFAQSLKRAKQLGIILDTDKLAALIGLNSINELSLDGKAQLDNKQQTKLPADKLAKLTNNINALVNQRQVAASQNLSAQERNQLSQITNDPNDLSNQNSSVNVVRKVVSFLTNADAVTWSFKWLVNRCLAFWSTTAATNSAAATIKANAANSAQNAANKFPNTQNTRGS